MKSSPKLASKISSGGNARVAATQNGGVGLLTAGEIGQGLLADGGKVRVSSEKPLVAGDEALQRFVSGINRIVRIVRCHRVASPGVPGNTIDHANAYSRYSASTSLNPPPATSSQHSDTTGALPCEACLRASTRRWHPDVRSTQTRLCLRFASPLFTVQASAFANPASGRCPLHGLSLSASISRQTRYSATFAGGCVAIHLICWSRNLGTPS